MVDAFVSHLDYMAHQMSRAGSALETGSQCAAGRVFATPPPLLAGGLVSRSNRAEFRARDLRRFRNRERPGRDAPYRY